MSISCPVVDQGAMHGQQQGVDGDVRDGEGVAGMERGVLDQEPDVADTGEVGVDDRGRPMKLGYRS
ncbi:hypothetical protein ABZ942_15705 [Nocardia sp. NPDC046473]|uniref:hypothetical protein n=1 Tax=Nocardia sp. NPDC046473 TaxID=3155733 RepID=UPI0033E6D5C0